MLNGDWSGQTLLDWALRLLFVVVRGYLIVDDTVVEKPHAKRGINIALLEHISPIEWENVILYGEYVINRDLIRWT
jgi:hypothetical protein